MTYDPLNPGWTTVGELKARGKGGASPLDPNARLFKERDISGIAGLAKRSLSEARRAAAAAGENPDAWFPTNPR